MSRWRCLGFAGCRQTRRQLRQSRRQNASEPRNESDEFDPNFRNPAFYCSNRFHGRDFLRSWGCARERENVSVVKTWRDSRDSILKFPERFWALAPMRHIYISVSVRVGASLHLSVSPCVNPVRLYLGPAYVSARPYIRSTVEKWASGRRTASSSPSAFFFFPDSAGLIFITTKGFLFSENLF